MHQVDLHQVYSAQSGWAIGQTLMVVGLTSPKSLAAKV